MAYNTDDLVNLGHLEKSVSEINKRLPESKLDSITNGDYLNSDMSIDESECIVVGLITSAYDQSFDGWIPSESVVLLELPDIDVTSSSDTISISDGETITAIDSITASSKGQVTGYTKTKYTINFPETQIPFKQCGLTLKSGLLITNGVPLSDATYTMTYGEGAFGTELYGCIKLGDPANLSSTFGEDVAESFDIDLLKYLSVDVTLNISSDYLLNLVDENLYTFPVFSSTPYISPDGLFIQYHIVNCDDILALLPSEYIIFNYLCISYQAWVEE